MSDEMKIESVSEPMTELPAPETEIPTTRIHECSDGRKRNEEQYQAWKLKCSQFEKDPDQFIHTDDIVMAVINTESGHAPFFGRYSIADCVLALGNLQFRFFTTRQEFEYKMKMEDLHKKGLVDANGKPIAAAQSGKIIT